MAYVLGLEERPPLGVFGLIQSRMFAHRYQIPAEGMQVSFQAYRGTEEELAPYLKNAALGVQASERHNHHISLDPGHTISLGTKQ